jgi:drug/metabolite transporter (DMT)-like permease
MSTFTAPSPNAPPAPADTARPSKAVWRTGLAAGAVASAATALVAGLAGAAGVSLEVGGEPIPPLGFANLTMIGAVVGVAIAAVLARRARRPRTTFVRVTVMLTLLSLVPDVIADADSSTRLILGLTHVLAAAIIVPAIAHRLAD